MFENKHGYGWDYQAMLHTLTVIDMLMMKSSSSLSLLAVQQRLSGLRLACHTW
jgi:hypothetical protein